MRIALTLALALAGGTCLAQNSADLPKRKAGLWEIKTGSPEMGGMVPTIQQCIDDRSDDLLAQQATEADCAKSSARRQGERLVVEAECTVDGTRATMKGHFTGDFDRAYRGEMHTTYEPPLHGMRSVTMTYEGRWLGPCKPGQRPGDVFMPGMGGFNMEEMMKNMPRGR